MNFGVIDNRFLAKSVGLLNPPPPLVLAEGESLANTLQALRDHKIGCVVIADPHGKLTAIFSERDVVLKVNLDQESLKNTSVGSVMTKNPHTASMTTTIAFAMTMMSQGGFRHIPLVDDEGFPVGIISVKNIIDYIAQSLEKDVTRVT